MPPADVTTSPIGEDEVIPETDSVIGGRYVVEELLGIGGMSVVFRARDLRLGHLVALKILKDSKDRRSRHARRFVREARIIAQLRSDHVVSVLDVDTSSEPPYLAMELIEGHTVAELLGAQGRFSTEIALRILVHACRGVADAHALGVIHRDLKPSNLMVTRAANGEQRVKVIDFGISKPLLHSPAQPDLTSTGEILGSPRYMSPEQVRGGTTIDARSDIWALGAILYELLAGVSPFEASTVADTLARIVRDTPTPLVVHAPEVPPRIAAIVALCLSKDRALRPPDVRALLEELEAVVPAGPLVVDETAKKVRPKTEGVTTQGTANRSWSLPRRKVAPTRSSRVRALAAFLVFAAVCPWVGLWVFGHPALRPSPTLLETASAAVVARPPPSSVVAIIPLKATLPPTLVLSASTPEPAIFGTSRSKPGPVERRRALGRDAGAGDDDLELSHRE